MHPLRMTLFFVGLIFAMFLAHAASAQITTQMKATAMEKMMPAERVSRMRECEKQMRQQKIKLEDRSHFVDECVWHKAK